MQNIVTDQRTLPPPFPRHLPEKGAAIFLTSYTAATLTMMAAGLNGLALFAAVAAWGFPLYYASRLWMQRRAQRYLAEFDAWAAAEDEAWRARILATYGPNGSIYTQAQRDAQAGHGHGDPA